MSTSELDLADLLRHVGDAITVQAADGSLVFANEAASELLGFESPEALVASPLGDLMARFDLLDADGHPLKLSALPGRRVMEGAAAADALVRFRLRDSAQDQWSLVRATRVERDGTLRYVVNAFQDVTALKRREVELRLLAEAGEVLGRSTDYQQTLSELAQMVIPELADWCVVDIFESGGLRRVAIAHHDPGKIALAEEVQRRYPPAEDSGVASVAASGEPLLISEVTDDMLTSSARDEDHLAMLRELGLRSALVVPLSARGTNLGAMTLIRGDGATPFSRDDLPLLTDLARRAGIAVDNARLLHDATESVRLRDDFLATASHDMRTPLATVLGYLQIAQRHVSALPEPGRVPDFLARAERTAVRLARLVAELMDVSLIRAGQRLPLALQEVDLVALVERAVSEHRQLSEHHDLTAETPHDSVIVNSDESRIERILDNLIGNAIKYSPERGPITLTTEMTADEARIRVTDQGVGIPQDELPTIFERFSRASTSQGAPGVGLGLAGSRDVARQLGGDITVVSSQGEGSTFTVHLPRRSSPGGEQPAVEDASA